MGPYQVGRQILRCRSWRHFRRIRNRRRRFPWRQDRLWTLCRRRWRREGSRGETSWGQGRRRRWGRRSTRGRRWWWWKEKEEEEEGSQVNLTCKDKQRRGEQSDSNSVFLFNFESEVFLICLSRGQFVRPMTLNFVVMARPWAKEKFVIDSSSQSKIPCVGRYCT